MTGDDFRRAVEARDIEGMLACLTDDVEFHSPVTYKPFHGKDAVRGLFTILVEHVFEDFTYTDQLRGDAVESLIFRARVGDRQVEGIDIMRFNAEGMCNDFTVIVRPMSGVTALAEAVGSRLAAFGVVPG